MHLSAMYQGPIATFVLSVQTRAMTFLCDQRPPTPSRLVGARPRAVGKEYNLMNGNTVGFLALAAITIAGCSTSPQQSSCEPMVAQICSRAAEEQLHDGTLMVGYSSQPEEARVVPLVVPVSRQDGVLAAEADCYVNTDSHTYSIVRSGLAIAPASQESVDFLRDRHLCADESSYAEGKHPGVETASALPVVTR